MRHRSFILLAALLMLLIFGSVGVYAVDAAQEDKIAEGVTVAGVDVGGMKTGEARSAVAQQVEEPLTRPLEVKYKGRAFKLTADQAGTRADVDGMIDEAVEKSRHGNMFSRVKRSITGGKVNAEVPVRVEYDHEAVDRLVKRVERGVERPATDAKVDFSGGTLVKVSGKPGVTLRADALRESIGDELTHPSPDRVVKARVGKTRPKVGIDDLADKYPTVVAINRGGFSLRVYKKLKLTESYRIAVGQQGLETPAGLYHVQNKAIDPAWHVPNSPWAGSLAGQVIPGGAPNNPLKSRWLGIYNGAGIHGTSDVGSLGSAASHGCIRMAVPDVMKVYDEVPVGAPVYIA
jgi:lipoprotein-anchoring transpeptidase ErfK/SrfK